MNNADLTPLVLLVLFSIAFAVGFGMVLAVLRQPRAWRERRSRKSQGPEETFDPPAYLKRPGSWLAVKSGNLEKVRLALRLQNPRPCPVQEGLTGEINLFISPPLKGWILVTGSGLPDPGEDVDGCYKFLVGLSRKLGEVQYFSANTVLQHHAWVRMVRGKVERAFAWAGQTVWVQGRLTTAEKSIGVMCPGYDEEAERTFDASPDFSALNVEKVPLLALKWSLDPAALETHGQEFRIGIAGECS